MKKLFNARNGLRGLYAIVAVIAFVLVIVLNIVMGMLADRYPMNIDLTSDKLFELGGETLDYIASIDEEVSIQVLATEEKFVNTTVYNAQANEIMRQFARCSDNIEISYIDYVANPTFASQFPDFTLKEGDVIVSSGDRDRQVKTEELFNYTYTQSGGLSIASSRAEEAILSAILYVVSDELTTVAAIEGHGESGGDAFLELLGDNNYDVSTTNLMLGGLSDEVDVALIVAPTSDYTAEEIDILSDFLENGGEYGKTLLYFAGADQPELPNLEAFLAEWGIAVGDGLVFETDQSRAYSTQPFYAITDYAEENYSSLLKDRSIPVLVPVCRPLETLYSFMENYSTTVLLSFGESVGVRPSDAGADFTAKDAEIWGPIPAVVMSSYRLMDSSNSTKELASSHVIVSGSTDILADYTIYNTSFANASYLVTVLNELCDREGMIAVTPKSIVGSALNLDMNTTDTIGMIFIAVVPLVLLAFGLAVWLVRRHK